MHKADNLDEIKMYSNWIISNKSGWEELKGCGTELLLNKNWKLVGIGPQKCE